MKKEIYGKPSFEQPLFSALDMQFILNENCSLKLKIRELEEKLERPEKDK